MSDYSQFTDSQATPPSVNIPDSSADDSGASHDSIADDSSPSVGCTSTDVTIQSEDGDDVNEQDLDLMILSGGGGREAAVADMRRAEKMPSDEVSSCAPTPKYLKVADPLETKVRYLQRSNDFLRRNLRTVEGLRAEEQKMLEEAIAEQREMEARLSAEIEARLSAEMELETERALRKAAEDELKKGK